MKEKLTVIDVKFTIAVINFKSIDQVSAFLQKQAPKLRQNRGKDTYSEIATEHAENYEVLQVFSTDNDKVPIVEFWKGYDATKPFELSAFYWPVMGSNPHFCKKSSFKNGVEEALFHA